MPSGIAPARLLDPDSVAELTTAARTLLTSFNGSPTAPACWPKSLLWPPR